METNAMPCECIYLASEKVSSIWFPPLKECNWMVIVEECEGLCKYDPCLDVIGPEHCLLEAWGSWAVTAGTL